MPSGPKAPVTMTARPAERLSAAFQTLHIKATAVPRFISLRLIRLSLRHHKEFAQPLMMRASRLIRQSVSLVRLVRAE